MRLATACLFALPLAACASGSGPVPAPPSPPAAAYRALGQEPGWTVDIAGDEILYAGDYGATRIRVVRPAPRPSFNGHRYETDRLIVDITHRLCHDAMSGHAFADTVMVIADGKTVHGCGGARLADRDQ